MTSYDARNPTLYVKGEKPKALPEDGISMAVLVESVRVDGKPQQRHIAYLGSIADSAPLMVRIRFWDKITERLDRLADRLSTAEHKKIEKALSARVPRPTAAQRKQNEARKAKIAAGLEAYLALGEPRRSGPVSGKVLNVRGLT